MNSSRKSEPRRGRSVRVRGAIAPLPVVMDEVVEVTRKRGGKRRGGRASVRSSKERPGPRPSDSPVVCDISEMPVGQGLETPLHPKRRRIWKPSNLAPAPPPAPSPPTASTSTSEQPDVEEEVVNKDTKMSPVARSAKRINYGSEAGSDESDNDELVRPFIPRVYRSTLETPFDLDENNAVAIDQPTAGDPAHASAPLTATDQPRRWYDFEWKAFPESPIPPESRREPFSESNVGPTTPRDDPYDIFVDIWDRKIMEHIASETNKYSQQLLTQMLDNHTLTPRSRISKWRDTTVDELYVYFGLVLAMGIVVKSQTGEYWNASRDVFSTPGFSAHMTADRFILLSRCLHFNDNKDMCAQKLSGLEARLYKIQPLMSHLNMKFQSMYNPAQNIALDESLLQWKGCLDINQFIPNKVAGVGIKTYEICESQTGYLWRFEIHAHKKSPPQKIEDPLEAFTPSIVLQLIQGLEHKGYTLWMDSFYNSPCLARRLKTLGFDCVGTVRTDRMFVPQALHSVTKRNMCPGQITGLTAGDVDVMVWRDNNRVAMISTYHGDAQQTVRGCTKPILILDYNIMMSGVDKKDQMLALYPIEQIKTMFWYKKLFRRLLNISVLNSYIIHHHTSSLSHRNFRIALVKSLLSKHLKHIISPLRPVITQKRRVDVSHRVAENPFVNNRRLRRLCDICKKRVQTFCVGCNKAVCIEPCFLEMHSSYI